MPNQPLRRLLALALGVMCLVPIAAPAGLSTSSQVTKKEVHSCDAGVDLIVAVQTHLRGSIGASMSRNRLAAISEITKLVFGETVQSRIDVQAEDEMETFRRKPVGQDRCHREWNSAALIYTRWR